jgi:hypothetical protein
MPPQKSNTGGPAAAVNLGQSGARGKSLSARGGHPRGLYCRLSATSSTISGRATIFCAGWDSLFVMVGVKLTQCPPASAVLVLGLQNDFAPCPAGLASPSHPCPVGAAASHPWPRRPDPGAGAGEQAQAQTQGCGVGAAGPEQGARNSFIWQPPVAALASARGQPAAAPQRPAPQPKEGCAAPQPRTRNPGTRDSPPPYYQCPVGTRPSKIIPMLRLYGIEG